MKDSKFEAEVLLKDLKLLSAQEIVSKYSLNEKKIDKVDKAISDIMTSSSAVLEIDYRPFDYKYTIYTGNSNGIMGRPRAGIMKHMLKENIALLTCRQQTSFDFQHVFVTNKISERCPVSLQTGEVSYLFPLYLYSEPNKQQSIDEQGTRIPNLNANILAKIASGLGLVFINEKDNSLDNLAPEDLLSYIYAILHSPSYREKYKEFLKIDFPRVPYPENQDSFWKFVKLGGELRQIHLLESPEVNNYITQYPIDGNNIVTKIRFEENYEIIDGDTIINMVPAYPLGRVYINDTQYFQMVPEVAWNFYIGGYQPAQKWLKDRKGRGLTFDDILHYQKIIVALKRTDEVMKEIDLVNNKPETN